MKKIIFLGSMSIFIVSATFAQTELASVKKDERSLRHELKEDKREVRMVKKETAIAEPGYGTAQQFMYDFPNATDVHWSRKEFEKASFMQDGKKLNAFYDFNSELIGTERDAVYEDLPANAKLHIAKYYSGFVPQAVILFDDNEYNSTDMILYERQFNDADNYFVELAKGNKKFVVQVSLAGDVSYFANMSKR